MEAIKIVKQTFNNLPEEKKQRITNALLTEFSEYPLANAQVARIVVQAQIARGAFYQYFTDLTDAYLYVEQAVLRAIHVNLRITKFDAALIYDQVSAFLIDTDNSQYRQLIKLHFTQNEQLLPKRETAQLLTLSPQMWTAMTLSHQVIKEILLNPANSEVELARFKQSLEIITKGLE